jgi:hypothetical protein
LCTSANSHGGAGLTEATLAAHGHTDDEAVPGTPEEAVRSPGDPGQLIEKWLGQIDPVAVEDPGKSQEGQRGRKRPVVIDLSGRLDRLLQGGDPGFGHGERQQDALVGQGAPQQEVVAQLTGERHRLHRVGGAVATVVVHAQQAEVTQSPQGPGSHRRRVGRRRGQDLPVPVPGFGVVAVGRPEDGQGADQAQGGVDVFLVQQPLQGGAQVVVVGFERLQDFEAERFAELNGGGLRHGQVVGGVVIPQGVGLAGSETAVVEQPERAGDGPAHEVRVGERGELHPPHAVGMDLGELGHLLLRRRPASEQLGQVSHGVLRVGHDPSMREALANNIC